MRQETGQHAGALTNHQKLLTLFQPFPPKTKQWWQNIWNKWIDYSKTTGRGVEGGGGGTGREVSSLYTVLSRVWHHSFWTCGMEKMNSTLSCFLCAPNQIQCERGGDRPVLLKKNYAHANCLFTENLGIEISCCWGRCHQLIGEKLYSSFFICARWTVNNWAQNSWVSRYHWSEYATIYIM